MNIAKDKKMAIRIAYERLAGWSKISGHITPNTSLYHEIESLIDDAIDLGRQSAFSELGVTIPDADLLRHDYGEN